MMMNMSVSWHDLFKILFGETRENHELTSQHAVSRPTIRADMTYL